MFLKLDANIIWNVVNILVLFLLLRLFLFKPVTKIMEDRQRAIADSIETAETERRKAGELRRDYEAQLANARREAAEIVRAAKEQAGREASQILRQARDDAGALLADAQKQIEAERAKALRDVRGQVAGLALLAGAKLAQKSMDAESERAFVNSFLTEVGER